MARCDSYVDGQCTKGACEYAPWVRDFWGNAYQWANAAAGDGLQLTSVPTVGAVVVYGAGDGYSDFGHVGVVTQLGPGGQFLVHEMNFAASFVYDDRWSNGFDVVGFILPPGTQPGAGAPPGGQGGPGPGWADSIPQAWAFWQQEINVTGPQLLATLVDTTAWVESFR